MPSTEPVAILDLPAVRSLMDAKYVVVTVGGGGIPVLEGSDGERYGVEAVIDKALTAALLANSLDADRHGRRPRDDRLRDSQSTEIERVTAAEMRSLAEDGHFASGSMGPKFEVTLRFVERGGDRAVITSLKALTAAIEAGYGTVIQN